MRDPALLIGVLVVLPALLAGCAGPAAPASAASASPKSSVDIAPDSNGTESLGAIEGKVTDDEMSPISGVAVTLLEADVRATTGEDGTFQFLKVPVGTYTVSATRPGFVASTKRAEVLDGATASVNLLLQPIPQNEPYHEVFNHVVLHNAEAGLVTWGAVYYGYLVNGTLPPFCESCRWLVTPAAPGDQGVVLEITGQHTAASPYGTGARETWYLYGNNTEAVETTIGYSVSDLPMNQLFAAGDVAKYDTYLLAVMCDTTWFCVNEKRDMWMSVFHGTPPPEGYTAAAPPE